MADWSQLPPELLLLIGKRLDTRFDILRFRSVCSYWRSSVSVPPKVYPYPFPTHLPSNTFGRCENYLSDITRHTLYLIRPSHGNQTQAPACWLVKISDGMGLFNPLTDSELKLIPDNFSLDLNKFLVIELGHEYTVRRGEYIDHPLEPQHRDYIQKLVYSRCTDRDGFIMLTRLSWYRLASLRSGENDWTLLEPSVYGYHIISFNGKFYVMEKRGRTIVVDQSLNVSFLGYIGSWSSIKWLVQCVDNLLAVEMLYDSDGESRVRYGRLVRENVVGFKVFKMNEEEQKWDEMESLRDQILFLDYRQAISASAFQFGWGRGNLIFFSECVSGYAVSEDRRMFVFDMETGTASPVEDCSAYCNLIWPPPRWVTSPE
ncbi:F-box family protein, putative isoform 1 [Hibiscus syriacus]|uniref:F-box family protein, putative isoform 1 n=1 Tax=Hibiscus syriacus TaxID=106335 RepID=A0A6A2ZFP6_HIBSY|nr:F-box protein SKIP23-like [Hibiscus syriacus]KAE8690698.1 F-box family protein, putative isoform 1 [Hibiscus syriacus]